MIFLHLTWLPITRTWLSRLSCNKNKRGKLDNEIIFFIYLQNQNNNKRLAPPTISVLFGELTVVLVAPMDPQQQGVSNLNLYLPKEVFNNRIYHQIIAIVQDFLQLHRRQGEVVFPVPKPIGNTVRNDWESTKPRLCSKLSLFKMPWQMLEVQSQPSCLDPSLLYLRAFQWGTVWHSTSRGIKNTIG